MSRAYIVSSFKALLARSKRLTKHERRRTLDELAKILFDFERGDKEVGDHSWIDEFGKSVHIQAVSTEHIAKTVVEMVYGTMAFYSIDGNTALPVCHRVYPKFNLGCQTLVNRNVDLHEFFAGAISDTGKKVEPEKGDSSEERFAQLEID